jgi:hypothetical protein
MHKKKGMKQISLSIIHHWHDMYHHSFKGFYAQSSHQAVKVVEKLTADCQKIEIANFQHFSQGTRLAVTAITCVNLIQYK